ncbi:hypothetical protein HCY21_06310 [Limosilactobacillus fermentum]|uniref:hypothetical protein n=1 Tax=Limosilactobacillus fermentum TaxID=1613 RepID=UPI0030058894
MKGEYRNHLPNYAKGQPALRHQKGTTVLKTSKFTPKIIVIDIFVLEYGPAALMFLLATYSVAGTRPFVA